MKLIIDIPDTLYESIQACKNIEDTDEVTVDKALIKAVENGKPLPKGHGDLKDADAICKDIISVLGIRDENYLLEAEEAVYKRIKNAPTIIEADKEESEVQENDIPWYLKIFNQDILNEYQKRMRDATPEERQKEVPYNDEGSNIHSEAYKEEQGMVEDRLNKTISDLAYILDSLISLRQIQNIGDCNICKNKDCGYMPKIGQMVRYNCPFYKAESEE